MVDITKAYQHILLELDGAIVSITLNRPQRRNALSLAHMRELLDCLTTIGQSHEVAVVVLRANGPVFCSGHDLYEMVGQDVEFYTDEFALCSELMELITSMRQPVIAQVHGMATAAGCQLVASCDLAVASEEARFATPGVKIGLFCSTPMVALSRAIGRKKALEMLLTGEPISAQEAQVVGLVNHVVPAAELVSSTHALARQIASASAFVVGLGKQAFYRQIDLPLHDAYRYASEVMTENALLEDAQEGMRAFLEKRQPQWRGR